MGEKKRTQCTKNSGKSDTNEGVGAEEGGDNGGEASEGGERHCSPSRSTRSSQGGPPRSRRTSSSSSSSSSLSLPPPPDGGWGWVVVAASFMAHLIADGCAFSFGVFYIEFLSVFGESKGKTAAVGSLFVAVPLLTGPVASAMTNRYGCRKTCMAGGFLAGCGFVASSFANSIEMLCVTFGLIAGFGLSMVYVPAIVVVAFYFEKKRAFATGIAVAGTGIGTFLFAPLTELLIQQYTWRGATLIIGGFMFNIMVAGTCFRPLTSPKLERQRRKFLDNQNKFSLMSSSKCSSFDREKGGQYAAVNSNGKGGVTGAQMDRLMFEPVTHSLMHFPTFLKHEVEPLYPNSIEALTKAGNDGKTLKEVLTEHGLLDKFYLFHSQTDVGAANSTSAIPNGTHGAASNTLHVPSPNKKVLHSISIGTEHVDVLATTDGLNGGLRGKRKISKNTRADFDQLLPMYRKDIFYRGSLMRARALPPIGKSTSCPNIAMHYEEESNSMDMCQRMRVGNCLKLSREAKNTFSRMLHVSIFRSSVFMYFCLSCFLLYLAYDVPYIFTPDVAKEMDVTRSHASILVSLIGITNTVGQVLLGWIGDFEQVNPIHLYNAITATAGVITMLVPWMDTYMALCAYSATYGFFISANYALTTIILVQLLGMDKLTNAYGIVMLAEGVANVIGPPAAGFISDATGSYDLTFMIAGAVIFISGFMLVLIPWLAKHDSVSHYREDYLQDDDSDSDSEQDEQHSNCDVARTQCDVIHDNYDASSKCYIDHKQSNGRFMKCDSKTQSMSNAVEVKHEYLDSGKTCENGNTGINCEEGYTKCDKVNIINGSVHKRKQSGNDNNRNQELTQNNGYAIIPKQCEDDDTAIEASIAGGHASGNEEMDGVTISPRSGHGYVPVPSVCVDAERHESIT